MKKVSLQVIAQKAEVSMTTASMVLNGKGDKHKINKTTQDKVLRIAKELNYRPNASARNLSRGKTMTIGIIVPNIADSYYSSIAFHLEQELAHSEYHLLLGSSLEDQAKEEELINAFLARQVDALLVATTQQNLELLEKVNNSGIPVVLFDRHHPNSQLPYIIVDNYAGIKKLVDHLYQSGHKAIGYIGLDLDLHAIHERQRAYRENYMDRFNMQTNYMRAIEYDNYAESCQQAVSELLTLGVKAIIFETHYLTLHGIKQLVELGVNYPDTVSIASFGDHEVFSIFSPHITAIDQPVDRIAKECLKVIFERMTNRENETTSKIKLEPELIIRNS
ncbi:MAG: LacI family DNA-binding transcriptional regulator [Marinilabiliaceae bacterium]|nr:LacI family DNA-binding transcriptional regulator [Marinilabiliaceae bacterium]